MHEVWSQELQCYRTRNASQVSLKYTCFYLWSVRIVSGLIFRISTETVRSDREKTPGGEGTLGISGWGCAAGTLEPLTYTRASSAEFCYPVLE